MNFATETVVTGEIESNRHALLTPEEIAPHFPQLEVLECLGRGGMGVVYKARQKSLGRLVALKLLAPGRERDPHFADRFSREAQALAQLDHPHIVTVHDFGQTNGFFYLLMEYVDGVNLRELLKTQKLTPKEALAIVPPLCDALQFAHERGIVHRDIKPENLLLTKDGRIKIADFGIARMLGETNDDQAAGTPGYMAPEQTNTPGRVDSRADIYSLGVVFYEILTGELPSQRIEGPSRKVHIDVRIDEIVLRALETEPALRFQTAAEMRTRLEQTMSGAGPGEVDKVWMKILGCVLLVPGIPIGIFGLIMLWLVLQDRNWNPGHSETIVTIGAWIAGIVLLGSSALLITMSRPRRARELPPLSPWQKAWLAQPERRRRGVFAAVAVVALGLFISFAWPHYEVTTLGDTSTTTMSFGFPEPWLKQIKVFLPHGSQNWPEQKAAGLLSFAAGLVGMGLWIGLCLLRATDARAGAPSRQHWHTSALDLALCVFTLAHAGLLVCALVPVQPILMMSTFVVVGAAALARGILKARTVHQQPPMTTGSSAAVAVVILVLIIMLLCLFIPASILTKAGTTQQPPAPAEVEARAPGD